MNEDIENDIVEYKRVGDVHTYICNGVYYLSVDPGYSELEKKYNEREKKLNILLND